MDVTNKRRINEKKFAFWEEVTNGRRYYLDVAGRHGWKARYVKVVDGKEETVEFFQEIYDSKGALIEVHEKFPIDKGHKQVREE